MTPEARLLQLYQQWRALTQAEAVAIQEGNWSKLLEAQDKKKSLQQQIDQVEQGRAGIDSPQGPPHTEVRETLHDLILLEQQNTTALDARKQGLQQEQFQLEKTSSNLHHLQRAYSASPAVVWQSYS
jgi:hypothetical protein